MVRPDVLLNAERPLPFAAGTFDRVLCHDVVEHLSDLVALMVEIHRVLRPRGRVFITTPHFSCANSFTDPTHRHHLGWHAFDYFVEGHALAYYCAARFTVIHRVLRFHGGWLDPIVRRIANRWPDFYEHRLTWRFPAWYLEIELEAVK